MAPEGAEFIKHIPAFKNESLIYGHKRMILSHSNVFHLKSPPFWGAGLPMKEKLKYPGSSYLKGREQKKDFSKRL